MFKLKLSRKIEKNSKYIGVRLGLIFKYTRAIDKSIVVACLIKEKCISKGKYKSDFIRYTDNFGQTWTEEFLENKIVNNEYKVLGYQEIIK